MKKIILVAIAFPFLPTITPADARVAKQRSIQRHVVMGAGVSPALLNANASLNGNGERLSIVRRISGTFAIPATTPGMTINAFGVMSVAE